MVNVLKERGVEGGRRAKVEEGFRVAHAECIKREPRVARRGPIAETGCTARARTHDCAGGEGCQWIGDMQLVGIECGVESVEVFLLGRDQACRPAFCVVARSRLCHLATCRSSEARPQDACFGLREDAMCQFSSPVELPEFVKHQHAQVEPVGTEFSCQRALRRLTYNEMSLGCREESG